VLEGFSRCFGRDGFGTDDEPPRLWWRH
jgi:hypothetical protein